MWAARLGLAAFVFLVSATANAGAWTPEPGDGYLKIREKWLPGIGYHSGDGRTLDYGTYHELSLEAYAEIGIVSGLAATLHAPLVNAFVLGDPRTDKTTGHVSVGDPAIGLRGRVLRAGRFVLSIESSLRIPFASSDPVQTVYGAEAGHPAIGALRVGTGVFDALGGVLFGYGWDRAYVGGSFGFVYRTGGFDDVLVWSLEGGGRLSERWSARLRFVGWHPVVRGDAPEDESPSGLGNGTQYIAFAIEADVRLGDRWFLGMTLEGGVAEIRRQTGGPVLSLYGAARW
jgi:hypothetical protein